MNPSLDIMDPVFYLYEADIRNEKYVPGRKSNQRHVRITCGGGR